MEERDSRSSSVETRFDVAVADRRSPFTGSSSRLSVTRLTYEVVTVADLNPQPLPPGRVRILIPNSVTFDLKKMNKITGEVLAKLGCGGCHSGKVLDFVTLQDFVVNPETLDVKETTGF